MSSTFPVTVPIPVLEFRGALILKVFLYNVTHDFIFLNLFLTNNETLFLYVANEFLGQAI